MKAYGVTTHRHTPEIEEQLGYAAGKNITVNIYPASGAPMNRGILATEYASLVPKADGTMPTAEDCALPMKNIMRKKNLSAFCRMVSARRQNGWKAATMWM